MQKEEDAAAALFIDLCRRSRFLRDWLQTVFASSPQVQIRFQHLLESPTEKEETQASRLLLNLPREADFLADTQRAIKRRLRLKTGRIYGGLTWKEIEILVRRYHAGTIDAGAFLLAHDWRKQAADGHTASFRLVRAGSALLDDALRNRQKRLLRHIGKAMDFLDQSTDARTRRMALGHVNWWKVSLLLYLLNHPKPAYRIREFNTHLTSLGLEIEPKNIRRFCSLHKILRDIRPGRPSLKHTLNP